MNQESMSYEEYELGRLTRFAVENGLDLDAARYQYKRNEWRYEGRYDSSTVRVCSDGGRRD